MAVGYIYILSNDAMPSIVKIGFTLRSVQERLVELNSATGVPKPFEIEYYCLTSDVEAVEAEAHKLFSSKRITGKEFFEITTTEAIKGIDSLIRTVRADHFTKTIVVEQNTTKFVANSDESKNLTSFDYSTIGPDDIYCFKCRNINENMRQKQFFTTLFCKTCGSKLDWDARDLNSKY